MTSLVRPTLALPRLTARRVVVCAGLLLLATALEKILANFARSKGVNIVGDEPSYVIQTQALLHGSLHIIPTIQHDLSAKVFGPTFKPGTPVGGVEHFNGPTGTVSPFEPGMSILLAPLVAILGPVTGAIVSLLAINTAGFMWLHQRVSRLFRLDIPAQLILAIVFAGPAVLLAATQIYPDLPAGLLTALGLVEVAAVEIEGRASRLSLVILTAAAAFLPWLQPKNILPAVVLFAALVWLVARHPEHLRRAGIAAAVISLSWVAFFLFNQHYYGHLLGQPEPGPHMSKTGLQYTLGLLFDKDQGLFVQVPWCLIGLAGLVAFGRRMPTTVVAAVLAFLSILLLNGTYVSNAYGGGSLAGRFQWSLIPMTAPWVGLVLRRLMERGRPLGWPLIVVGFTWIYQFEPILAGHHDFYNPLIIAYQPYPGWWARIGAVLPRFGRDHHFLGTPSWAFPAELALAAVFVAGVLLLTRKAATE